MDDEGLEWWLEMKVAIRCQFDFKMFPFDTQVRYILENESVSAAMSYISFST